MHFLAVVSEFIFNNHYVKSCALQYVVDLIGVQKVVLKQRIVLRIKACNDYRYIQPARFHLRSWFIELVPWESPKHLTGNEIVRSL